MTSPPEDLSSRIGEDARDSAVQRLQEAYTEGHISHEEMDEGLDQVLAARTRRELVPVLASLPAEKAATASTISAAAGRIKRRGPWGVPRTLKVESAFGKVSLDLSRAVFEHPVVDIELQLGTGKAKITVPRDAIVDIEDLHAGWKPSDYKPRKSSGPGDGPRIRIFGAMGYGRLKVRHARR
ncbi:DUF1707 domain-containing protein [Streptomyces sp. NPDC048370]|uniref:DUF1707 SHOCT-like domain-containing protein n=1 Tax=Streptomyces sp. NPDC048370 TaxID=3365540 RepID=UPI003718843C